MPSPTPYLQRRGGTLHFRIAVPRDIVPHLQVHEVTRALGTSDRDQAAVLALELAARVKGAYWRIRQGVSMDKEKLDEFMRETRQRLKLDGIREQYEAELLDQRVRHLRELKLAKLEAANATLTALVTSRHSSPPPSPALRAAPLAGASAPATVSAVPVAASPTLKAVIDDFLKKQSKSKARPMLSKHRTVLPLLLDVVGDKPVDELRQKDLNGFFEVVCALPPQWKTESKNRKLGPAALAALGLGSLAPKSFEDTYKASVRLFLKDARRDWQDEGFPATLTLEGISYTGQAKDGQNKQRAFRPGELRRLFGAELAALRSAPATEHMFWLPHIGLYTGARINEICQINPQTDIAQEQATGIWYFDFTEETPTDDAVEKSIKNRMSRRRVPVHDSLIALGFLDYVERLRKSKARLIFPAWKPSRGRASPKAEKWFGQFLEDLGLRDETPGQRLVGMHAFRHLILHRAHNAVPPVDITPITGHSDGAGAVVAGYRGELSLKNKSERLRAIDFTF